MPYPNESIPFPEFSERLVKFLAKEGFSPEKTLLCASVCRDEICDVAVKALEKDFGSPFSMAALGGYPIGGLTALGAASHHVADGGAMLVIGTSHIGQSPSGVLGKYLRAGMSHESTSCGALCALLKKVHEDPGYKPSMGEFTLSNPETAMDADQTLLELVMVPKLSKDTSILDATVTLARCVEIGVKNRREDRAITAHFKRLFAETKCDFPVIYVGGIDVNMPLGHADEMHLLDAFVIRPDGKQEDILRDLK